MIILQTPFCRDIPEAVATWTVVLEQGGFALLSSEPLLQATETGVGIDEVVSLSQFFGRVRRVKEN